MYKERFDAFMKECPAVAILRGITIEEMEGVCDALYNAGIRLMEVPLNTPNAFQCIALAVKHCGDKMMVGAGTVLTAEDVTNVAQAGGKFIISPNTDPEVIQQTKRLELVSIPGFFTASEGFTALKAGADYLKLFPAMLGPGYIKDLKAVIKAPIMAVGGVNVGNIPDFMKVCCGVGIGSALYKPGKSLEDIAKDAKLIKEAVSSK